MKKPLLYILLFFYLAVQLKPLTAIVQDAIAHTFFKMQHMATIHYENGKYHLHTELETISKEDGGLTKDKTSTTEKAENNSQQISHEVKIKPVLSSDLISLNVLQAPEHKPGFTSIDSPPPKTV